MTNFKDELVSVGSTLNFQVSGFRNPIDLRPINGFVLKTLDDDFGLIEVSDEFSIAVSQPALITGTEVTIDEGSS